MPKSFTSGAQTYAVVAGNLPESLTFWHAAPAASRSYVLHFTSFQNLSNHTL
jgi:hypothetical protein